MHDIANDPNSTEWTNLYSYSKILCSDENDLTIVIHKIMLLNKKKNRNKKSTQRTEKMMFRPYTVQKQATLSHTGQWVIWEVELLRKEESGWCHLQKEGRSRGWQGFLRC